MPELHLAVALDGAGWHPAAWRETAARPADLFSAGYWVDLAQQAEAGLLDFLTIEDSFGLQSTALLAQDNRTDQVRGRLDAVLIAARVAPKTSSIGLVPTALVTHTEPFHVSKAIATLDYVSTGRAGVRVQVSVRADENAHFGRRTIPELTVTDLDSPAAVALVDELFGEATEYIEVVRRLWDSWQDDAEIRDVATGRFIDRDRIHYIDFKGQYLSVKGPSIVPRPPQGQPLVTALAHSTIPYLLAARSSDVAYVTPTDASNAADIIGEIRREQESAGRGSETLHVFGDLVVFLDTPSESGAARLQRLNTVAGAEYTSDALIFTGSAGELADLLTVWQRSGITGYRLRPGALPDDLTVITEQLVPELQARGLFRRSYQATTLRGLLGFSRPANRYTTTEGALV